MPRSGGRQRRSVDPAGAYLAALSRMLTSTCSSSTPSASTSGRLSGRSAVQLMTAQRRRASGGGRAPIRFGQVQRRQTRLQRAMAEPGHVEQVLDIAVQPLALFADVLGQILCAAARARSGVSARLPAAPMMVTSGVRRSWLTDDRSAVRRRSVSDGKPGFRQLFGQAQPFQRQGDLVDQRIQQPPVGARKQRGRRHRRCPARPARRSRGDQRQEEPARRGQRVRAVARGLALVPGRTARRTGRASPAGLRGEAADDLQVRPCRRASAGPTRSAGSWRHG